MFERFPSLTRFSHGWTVTEKLDGTNAQILIAQGHELEENDLDKSLGQGAGDGLFIFAGSRSRMITPDSDNMGFARFVQDNAQDLIEALGEGRHFGEWWGNGIQRNYGLKEKRFSLFNAHRWRDVELPDRVGVVPIVNCLIDTYIGDPRTSFGEAMDDLKRDGSLAAPGFMNPEGIVMYHRPSGTTFKKTFDYDEQGKWAENERARSIS